MEQETKREREITDLFRVGMLIKGTEGVLELMASVFVYFIPLTAITRLADHFTVDELSEDPHDFIASHLYNWAHSISIGSKDFAALYFLIHGLVKLGLAIALLKGYRRAYPIGIAVMLVLISYQSYRIFLHHSPLLIAGTLLDCAITYLIWREWQIVRAHEAKHR